MQTDIQQLRSKVKYLEDRIEVMTKSLGKINNILGRFQMTEDKEQSAFSDLDIKNIREDIEQGTHELI
jgi:prefoldin subunit 5